MTRAVAWLWHQVEDKSEEAKAELQKLKVKDAEVTRLGRELREAQRRNNFSGMVADAISRVAKERA